MHHHYQLSLSNVLMPFQLFFGCFWQFLAIDNSFFILQHHCRKCGSVVCASCSSQKFLMPAQSSKPLRVCDPCYAILSKTETTALPSSTVEGKQNLKSSKYFAVLISRNVLVTLQDTKNFKVRKSRKKIVVCSLSKKKYFSDSVRD